MKTELEQLKEQLNSISEKIKQLETPSFQKGWYKLTNSLALVYCDFYALKDNSNIGYGFDGTGRWVNNWHYYNRDKQYMTPATDKEVEEALIKEAKKRGFKEGVKIKSIYSETTYNTRHSGFGFYPSDYSIYFGNWLIFKDGIWAEIIKDEPLKVCGYEVKKKADDSDIFEIGCKHIHRIELQNIKDFMYRCGFTEVTFDQYEVSLETINKILEL